MRRAYLVRYGVARSIAQFVAEPDGTDDRLAQLLERGVVVVIRTHRGTELGEILGEAPAGFHDDPSALVAPLLRVATSADMMQAQRTASRRATHFATCQTVFDEGIWPLELIDAEPLLDDERTVLHYLGPHRLDAAGLVAIFRERCGLDVVLEPVGRDLSDEELAAGSATEEPVATADDHGCGSCGSKSGGCGSCGSAGAGCAVKALVGNRSKKPAKAGNIPQMK